MINETCACPNLECPNHGSCENCTSRNLKIKTLNYCGFYSIKHLLEELKDEKKVNDLLNKHNNAYDKLTKKNNLSKERQELLRNNKMKQSPY